MILGKKSRTELTYRLLLSFVGLLIVVFLVAFPPTVTSISLWRKPIIGTIFGILCFLGVLAVIFPTTCSRLLEPQKQNSVPSSTTYNSQERSISLKGHHPACGNYSAHVFQLLGKTCCAACVGLLFGGFFALVGSIFYFFVGLTVSDYSLILVVLGSVGIMIGLFQFAFKGPFRLLANTLFVVSTLLVLISVDSVVGGLFFDLFVLCLIVFWLFTRISLSKWDHKRICSGCEVENCSARP